jgi:hypothetical protein
MACPAIFVKSWRFFAIMAIPIIISPLLFLSEDESIGERKTTVCFHI